MFALACVLESICNSILGVGVASVTPRADVIEIELTMPVSVALVEKLKSILPPSAVLKGAT